MREGERPPPTAEATPTAEKEKEREKGEVGTPIGVGKREVGRPQSATGAVRPAAKGGGLRKAGTSSTTSAAAAAATGKASASNASAAAATSPFWSVRRMILLGGLLVTALTIFSLVAQPAGSWQLHDHFTTSASSAVPQTAPVLRAARGELPVGSSNASTATPDQADVHSPDATGASADGGKASEKSGAAEETEWPATDEPPPLLAPPSAHAEEGKHTYGTGGGSITRMHPAVDEDGHFLAAAGPLPPMTRDQRECQRMMEEHKVVPFHGWGSLPRDKIKRWGTLRCNLYIDTGSRAIKELGFDQLIHPEPPRAKFLEDSASGHIAPRNHRPEEDPTRLAHGDAPPRGIYEPTAEDNLAAAKANGKTEGAAEAQTEQRRLRGRRRLLEHAHPAQPTQGESPVVRVATPLEEADHGDDSGDEELDITFSEGLAISTAIQQAQLARDHDHVRQRAPPQSQAARSRQSRRLEASSEWFLPASGPLPQQNSVQKECQELMVRHHVRPFETWGSMPLKTQDRWKQLMCGKHVDTSMQALREHKFLDHINPDGTPKTPLQKPSVFEREMALYKDPNYVRSPPDPIPKDSPVMRPFPRAIGGGPLATARKPAPSSSATSSLPSASGSVPIEVAFRGGKLEPSPSLRPGQLWCVETENKHGVIYHTRAGQEWGTLDTRQKWNKMGCRNHVLDAYSSAGIEIPPPNGVSGSGGESSSTSPETAAAPSATAAPAAPASAPASAPGAASATPPTTTAEAAVPHHETAVPKAHDFVDPELLERCRHLAKKYNIKDMNLKALSETKRNEWKRMHCSMRIGLASIVRRSLPVCGAGNTESDTLVAMVVATTSRRIHKPSVRNMAPFFFLLPSFARTLDCGYKYLIVMGYDSGDVYMDTDDGRREVQDWFRLNIGDPLARHNVSVELNHLRVDNRIGKPGPVFNAGARVAYDAGAEYILRVNDDTELVHRWPRRFASALQSLGEPFGVVGPACKQGNVRILTHDFTHRRHMEIFQMDYYPPKLVDWWLDDWISRIYGSERTFRDDKVEVIHHTHAHGTRYTPDHSRAKLLDGLVRQGVQRIQAYLKAHHMNAELARFEKDRHNGGPYRSVKLPAQAAARRRLHE